MPRMTDEDHAREKMDALMRRLQHVENRIVELEDQVACLPSEAVDDGARIEIEYTIDRIIKLELKISKLLHKLDDAGVLEED